MARVWGRALVLVALAAMAAGDAWDYAEQNRWPGQCCRNGARQSPIDFRDATPQHLVGNYALRFKGSCRFGSRVTSRLDAELHGFTIVDPGLHCYVDDPLTNDQHRVTEVRIHYQSEHALPDGPGDFELQVLTESHHDEKLVLSAIFRQGPEEPPLTNSILLDLFRRTSATDVCRDTSLLDLLPPSHKSTMLYYTGSATTPPCAENVHWVVFEQAVPVSSRVVRELRDAMRQRAGAPFVNNRNPWSTTPIHNVKLLNSGGYQAWALFSAEHSGRRLVLCVIAVMVGAGFALLLYFRREGTHGDEGMEWCDDSPHTPVVVSKHHDGDGGDFPSETTALLARPSTAVREPEPAEPPKRPSDNDGETAAPAPKPAATAPAGEPTEEEPVTRKSPPATSEPEPEAPPETEAARADALVVAPHDDDTTAKQGNMPADDAAPEDRRASASPGRKQRKQREPRPAAAAAEATKDDATAEPVKDDAPTAQQPPAEEGGSASAKKKRRSRKPKHVSYGATE